MIYATQTPLYAPKPDRDGAHEPALAEGQPEISDDEKTVTVKLKKGVKFAPPVNREIQAKDIKYAFERAFTEERPEPVHDVLQLHRGRARRSRGELQDIPGIVVDRADPYKITFKLSEAAGRRASRRS